MDYNLKLGVLIALNRFDEVDQEIAMHKFRSPAEGRCSLVANLLNFQAPLLVEEAQPWIEKNLGPEVRFGNAKELLFFVKTFRYAQVAAPIMALGSVSIDQSGNPVVLCATSEEYALEERRESESIAKKKVAKRVLVAETISGLIEPSDQILVIGELFI